MEGDGDNSNGGGLLRAYRGAVVLNNLGVAMLQGRAFRQAMDTLKDSVVIMKDILKHKKNSRALSMGTEEVNKRLQQAFQRTASPQPSRTGNCFIEITVCDDVDLTSLKSAQQYGPSASFAYPIRIECTGDEQPEDRDIDFDSAIMLYNFGVSQVCAARVTKKSTAADLIQNALSIFELSHAVLASCSVRSRNDTFHQIRQLILSAMVLNNIVHVLMMQGKTEEVREASAKLVELGHAIHDMDHPEEVYGGKKQASAAAA